MFPGTVVADSIPGLIGTGQGTVGGIDPNYTIATSPAPVTGPIRLNNAYFPSVWWGSTRWIGVNDPYASDSVVDPVGWYEYTIQFDLSGLDPTTAEFHGYWSVDNYGSLSFIGASTGITRGGSNPWHQPQYFQVNQGNGIPAGIEHHLLLGGELLRRARKPDRPAGDRSCGHC
jgi:hypothetical protein